MCDKGRKWSAAFRCCRQVDLKRHLESKDFPFLHPYPLHVLKGCVNRVRHPTWTWKFSSISAFIWTTLSFFCSAMASIPCYLHYSLPFSLRASHVFCLAVAWQPPPQVLPTLRIGAKLGGFVIVDTRLTQADISGKIVSS